jgi:hypothetical protein
VKLKANIGPKTPYELAIVEANPNSSPNLTQKAILKANFPHERPPPFIS